MSWECFLLRELDRRFDAIDRKLVEVEGKINQVLAAEERVIMSLAEFLAVTAEMKTKIKKLQDAMAAGGMNAAEEAQLLAELKLVSRFADPTQPNPTAPAGGGLEP